MPFFKKRKQPQKKEAETQKECNIQEVMEEIDKVLDLQKLKVNSVLIF